MAIRDQTIQWAMLLAHARCDALQTVRHVEGIQILAEPQERQPLPGSRVAGVWIRGLELNSESKTLVAALPSESVYQVRNDSLFGWSNLVPDGRMPDGNWVDLSNWIQLVLPQALLAGLAPSPGKLHLVRSDKPVDANVMMTDLAILKRWSSTAAAIRLQQLRIAANAQGEVVIWGAPLPPIPGRFLCEQHGVAIPAGWQVSPPVPLEMVRKKTGIENQ